MQIELCFGLSQVDPAGKISSPDWRRKLAAASNDELPSWFFGRDETGNTIKDFPQIRFLGGRRALRLVAFGKDSSDRLASLMPALFKLVNRVAGTAVPVRLNEYDVSAKPGYQRLYHVNAPMLTRRGDRRERYANDAAPEARMAHLRKRIVHGLSRQAEFFGLDFPSEDEIDIIECGDYRAKRVHDGFGYGVQYAVVGMPVELSGVWQTGLLLSHGHGTVTPYRRRAEEKAAA